MSGYAPIQGSGSGRGSSNYGGEAGRVGGQEEVVAVNKYETSVPMPVGVAASMAYVLGPVSGFLFLVFETKNDYVRFHAWQASLVLSCMLLLHVVFCWTSVISWMLFVCDLAIIAFLSYQAFQLSSDLIRFKIPFLGDLASLWVDEENE
eukprot:comp12211_c0_seq1/m.6979 comp12211_c0_seq1/g.6979  ORF comp12211_c0_seq1/g.6979 comp12211_c0_seq1/m.6979 type:complete len:149 (-) comp12211_c0_seq1:309-755(-)